MIRSTAAARDFSDYEIPLPGKSRKNSGKTAEKSNGKIPISQTSG
jgi:hypothetical protein